ncbi:hypothetical protein P4S64_06825 [Vibrio sp. M60_M31a]
MGFWDQLLYLVFFGLRLIRSKSLLIFIAVIGLLGLFAVAGISDRQSGGAAEDGIDASAHGTLACMGSGV